LSSPEKRRPGGTSQQPPVPARMLVRTWNQALHSDAWWEGERQQLQVETREVQSGDEDKPFSPQGKPGRGTGYPESLCSLHPSRFSRSGWIKP